MRIGTPAFLPERRMRGQGHDVGPELQDAAWARWCYSDCDKIISRPS